MQLAQKHNVSTKINYKSGFFITTNEFPNFGGGRDEDAIRKRLAIFETVALPSKNPTVSGKSYVVILVVVICSVMLIVTYPRFASTVTCFLGQQINFPPFYIMLRR